MGSNPIGVTFTLCDETQPVATGCVSSVLGILCGVLDSVRLDFRGCDGDLNADSKVSMLCWPKLIFGGGIASGTRIYAAMVAGVILRGTAPFAAQDSRITSPQQR